MCQFISFFHRPDTGDIAVYDVTSHAKTEEHLSLNKNLWREGHWLPDGELVCRVLLEDKSTAEECADRMKDKYPAFIDFFEWIFDGTKKITASDPDITINLRGCDLSKLKTWPDKIGGSLYLSGCKIDKKTIPENLLSKCIF